MDPSQENPKIACWREKSKNSAAVQSLREALGRQLLEIEGLEAIFPATASDADHVELRIGEKSKTAAAAWVAGGGGGGPPPPPLKLEFRRNAPDELKYSDPNDESVAVDTAAVILRIELPHAYPIDAVPTLEFVPSPHIAPSHLAEIAESVSAVSVPHSECLFDVLQKFGESVAEALEMELNEKRAGNAALAKYAERAAPSPQSCHFSIDLRGGDVETQIAAVAASFDVDPSVLTAEIQKQISPPDRGPPVLGRRLMYSHHIRNPGKRQAIMSWAVQLGLSGASRIGYPGLIVIEGAERNCQAYVGSIQRLRWKFFTVRGEQQVEGDRGQTIDDLRAFPRGFFEFGPGGNSMAEFAKFCRDAGLEDLFFTAMKVYRSSSK